MSYNELTGIILHRHDSALGVVFLQEVFHLLPVEEIFTGSMQWVIIRHGDIVLPHGWHTLDLECKGVLSIGV